MSGVALRAPPRGVGESLEFVDAFAQQAMAIAAGAAAPNTRRAYATAYRAFAGFLQARCGEACLATFAVAAVAAWRDHLHAQGLAASTVAQRVCAVRRSRPLSAPTRWSRRCAAPTSSTSVSTSPARPFC